MTRHGVQGYEDKPGFGRRTIPLTVAEVEELVAYQTGALLGVAGLVRGRTGALDLRVTHVKPHGALVSQFGVAPAGAVV